MGGGAGGAVVVMVVVILILSEGTRGGNATKHVVGGSQGWDVSTDLTSWASSHTFKVGDQLEFKYTVGLHSVVEVGSESAYKNCNIGNSLNSMNGGNDVVKLTKTGTRYFVCGTPGHCAQGMKLKINILSASASAPAPEASSSSSSTPTSTSSPSTPTSTSSPSTPTSTSAAYTLQSFAYLILTMLSVSITISLLTVIS